MRHPPSPHLLLFITTITIFLGSSSLVRGLGVVVSRPAASSLLRFQRSLSKRTTTLSSVQKSSSSSNSRSSNRGSSTRSRLEMAAQGEDNGGISSNPMLQYGLPTPLLLGSASFTRKLILKEMGVDFLKLVRPIDEKALGDRDKDEPEDLVLRLGRAKMAHLVQEIRAGRCDEELKESGLLGNDSAAYHHVVLTGDQVVTCNGQILEKPESIEQARDFVAEYGRHPPSTVGSVVLHHVATGIQVSGTDTATIYFDFADDATAPQTLIDDLLQDGAPVLDCAGGLMVEHPLVKRYITRIDGTEDSVMGLSKDLVLRLLQELAQQIKAKSSS